MKIVEQNRVCLKNGFDVLFQQALFSGPDEEVGKVPCIHGSRHGMPVAEPKQNSGRMEVKHE